METTIKLGDTVKFTAFGKEKKEVQGKVIKIFVSKKDNKNYCMIKIEKKLYTKQIQKVEIINF